MIVPQYRMDSYGRRCFAVVGPSTCNSLPDSLCDSAPSLSIFRRHLKTHFFCLRNIDETYVLSALDDFYENVLYTYTLYLLTGELPDKTCRPYNLYCVGADVKPCSINQKPDKSIQGTRNVPSLGMCVT